MKTNKINLFLKKDLEVEAIKKRLKLVKLRKLEYLYQFLKFKIKF